MKRHSLWIMIILAVAGTHAGASSLSDLMNQAGALGNQQNYEAAVEILEKAVAAYPDAVMPLATLGYYQGIMAGQTSDYIKAGTLVNQSFEKLDKAVEMDPDNIETRLYRGVISTNVPAFFGRMEEGIGDLAYVIQIRESGSGKVPPDQTVTACRTLASAYEKKGNPEKAREILKKLIDLEPESDAAGLARQELNRAAAAEAPAESETAAQASAVPDMDAAAVQHPEIVQARDLMEAGKYSEAVKILKNILAEDENNKPAVFMLLNIIQKLSGTGYGASIHEDTNLRANLAMDAMKYMDKAVSLEPDNLTLRLQRNAMGIYMPFFVGKLDDSMRDLEAMMQDELPGSIHAEALYLLGVGYQKKGLRAWNQVISDYPGQDAAAEVKQAMKPPIRTIDTDTLAKPAMVIDFVIGYQDQLAPQTAVWIETESGEYVRTLYVSGFSGHVKEKQVVLPQWAAKSGFRNVDGVTAASIDAGEHILVWDLKDGRGQQAAKGKYNVIIEVSCWPSMMYQKTAIPVEIGKKSGRWSGKTGDCISLALAQYLK